MIVYELQCGRNHRFEGWFQDNAAFHAQLERGLITCPVCNDTSVTRIPSTFCIRGPHKEVRDTPPDEAGRQVAELGRMLARYVDTHFENVGCDFAREALKIHYGVSSPRNIRGVSTEAEEKTLRDEGVTFFKIPQELDNPES